MNSFLVLVPNDRIVEQGCRVLRVVDGFARVSLRDRLRRKFWSADTPTGDGHVLYDPMADNPTLPPFVSWISPLPDGQVLALGVCSDGSENNTIRLINVATGEFSRRSASPDSHG